MKNSMQYSNYRLPPNPTDTIAMLRYFGVALDTNPDGELEVRVFNPQRLPKLSFPKTNNPNWLFFVTYPGPPYYGMQSFSFTIDDFKDISDIVTNDFQRFILSVFSLTPTMVKQVYRHRKGQFKLSLMPSIQKIKRVMKNG